MLLLLVAVFIVVPLLEIWVIIKVGGAIGAGPTVAILLADSILGAVLLRSQGRGAWVRFNRALAESRMPAKEVFDGVLVIFGGALLLTPGFITDVVGLLLLIPPSRGLVRAASRRLVIGRLAIGPRAATWGYGRMRERRARRRPAPGAGPDPGAGTGAADPGSRPAAGEETSDWDEALFPGRARRQGPSPDDIEGTAHEVGDDDRLPPAEGEPPPR